MAPWWGTMATTRNKKDKCPFSLGACEGDSPEINTCIIPDIPGANEDDKRELWARQHWVLEGLFQGGDIPAEI